MKRHTAARMAWGIWGLSLVLAAMTWLLLWLNRSQTPFSGRLSEVALPVLFATPGAVIVARRPANPIGWIFCAIGLTQGITGFANEYGHHALVTRPGSLPGGVPALMTTVVWVVLFGCIPLLVLLFPDGQLPSRRWRPLIWAVAAAIAVLLGSLGRPGRPTGHRGQPAARRPDLDLIACLPSVSRDVESGLKTFDHLAGYRATS